MDAYEKLVEELHDILDSRSAGYKEAATALLRSRIEPLVKALEASPEFVIDGRDDESRCWSCRKEVYFSNWAGTTSKPIAIYKVNHSTDCQRQLALALFKELT